MFEVILRPCSEKNGRYKGTSVFIDATIDVTFSCAHGNVHRKDMHTVKLEDLILAAVSPTIVPIDTEINERNESIYTT